MFLQGGGEGMHEGEKRWEGKFPIYKDKKHFLHPYIACITLKNKVYTQDLTQHSTQNFYIIKTISK